MRIRVENNYIGYNVWDRVRIDGIEYSFTMWGAFETPFNNIDLYKLII